MEKIQYCPFCKVYNGKVAWDYDDRTSSESVYVLCGSCAARGPYVDAPCGQNPAIKEIYEGMAITAWNRHC